MNFPRLDVGERAVFGLDGCRQGAFVFSEFGSDVFKTRQGFNVTDAKMITDGSLKIGGDVGLHQHRVSLIAGVDDPLLAEFLHSIPRHERANLIAGDQLEFARLIAHHNAHAVAIRVGADNDVRAFLFRQINPHLQGGGIFRIGGFHRWESTVRNILLGNRDGIEPEFTQNARHQHATAAMDGGVNNFERPAFLQNFWIHQQ